MRGEDVLDGLAGNALHFGDDLVVILFELVIDQDDAFASDIDADVTTVADDLVEVVFHFADR